MVASEPGETARAVVSMLGEGRFAEVVDLFAAPLRALVSAAALEEAWAGAVARAGAVSAVGEPDGSGPAGVRVPVTCERGGFAVVLSLDEAGLLDGLRLAAADWTAPPYADPETFREQEVTIGSGALAVPGTLSVPRGRGPWPGVVLLGGGGPFDRDATSGPNKPLKDLAWGLAGRGVAVVRFDKVTHAHAARVAALEGFTMTEEYVPHAVAAVRLLRDRPDVDAARVFVAGHSMGGKVAPRVAAAEPSVAGLVIMAGDAEPMHRAAVRVVRHLASVSGDPRAADLLETVTRQAALADSPELSPATAAADLPFGLWPGSYWLDLRGYDPVGTAAALERPMLILQGARDYQVTVEDDLARWRAGLEHRPDVTIRVYDADDHLFFPGAGPSTPADYARAQHVDPDVVEDVARWLAES
ncbi:alpha/beta hydrolase family protein [Nonomuraea muscovyensis]